MTLKEAIEIIYGLVIDVVNEPEEAEAVDVFSNYLKEQGLHPWPEREEDLDEVEKEISNRVEIRKEFCDGHEWDEEN